VRATKKRCKRKNACTIVLKSFKREETLMNDILAFL